MIRGIISDFYDVIFDSNSRDIRVDVVDILRKYSSLNIPIYLFTNSSANFLSESDSKTKFLDIFTECVSTHKYGVVKPSGESFSILLKSIGSNPNEFVLIDDKQENIEKAKQYGFVTIQYIDPVQLRKELDNLDIIA